MQPSGGSSSQTLSSILFTFRSAPYHLCHLHFVSTSIPKFTITPINSRTGTRTVKLILFSLHPSRNPEHQHSPSFSNSFQITDLPSPPPELSRTSPRQSFSDYNFPSLSLLPSILVLIERLRRECPNKTSGAGIFLAAYLDGLRYGECPLTYAQKGEE